MKRLLLIIALLPIWFLTGCGDSDPTRGFKPGMQVAYSTGKELIGKGRNHFDGAWVVEVTPNTITIRKWEAENANEGEGAKWRYFYQAQDIVYDKSSIDWMERTDKTGPMPEPGDEIPR